MNKEESQLEAQQEQLNMPVVSERFLCDVCGEEKYNNQKHEMYDENWNLQEGLNMCEKCYREGLGVG